MGKRFLLFASVIFLSCSDGDLQIETLDFDDVAVDDCNDISAVGANILFKISGDEALILELQSGLFNNGISANDTMSTTSLIPSQSQLTYRLFSTSVNNAYFCSAIPPATPNVTEEITASAGRVTVKSIAVSDSTAFEHAITLDSITLVNANGERITDLTVSDFGTITIPISN